MVRGDDYTGFWLENLRERDHFKNQAMIGGNLKTEV
jgi:hypothetical protein